MTPFSTTSATLREPVSALAEPAFWIRVLSNPSTTFFTLQLNSKADNAVQLRVYDLLGRVVEQRPSLAGEQTLRLGSTYKPGIYLLEVVQGTQNKP